MSEKLPPVEKCDWTAFEFIKWFGVLPLSIEKPPNKERAASPPSNSEIRRWLDQGSVQINGVAPKANDIITFPMTQLVFFPKSDKKRATVI